ncbi:MAG: hypothetical protein Q3M24_21605 [Candidatus Electrothrix aestuarii]|uniref:Pyocin activator protein PrtN n=1 Tax=Candidatus Electrothrix aestuarii TaxID=3062594 RepID=A0AAU8LV17_9BACT|nr:hypothetical protein [Candidatus Electrothrix aestuarii]
MSNKIQIEVSQEEKQIDLSAFAEKWPSAFVERSKLSEFSGGVLNGRTMANLDSKGTGIKGRVKIGDRKVIYPVHEVISWLEARASLPKKSKCGQDGERT